MSHAAENSIGTDEGDNNIASTMEALLEHLERGKVQ